MAVPGHQGRAPGHAGLQSYGRLLRIVLRRRTQGRVARNVLTVQGVLSRDADFNQILCADISGFNLHAAVRCTAKDCQALEQLCRYITRPLLADERVRTNAAGQAVLKLKTPHRDGTTRLVMSPTDSRYEHIDGRFVAARSTVSMSATGRFESTDVHNTECPLSGSDRV
jgi:hypothetical protein